MATQWGRIKAEYLRGGTTYKELAEKYGVSVKTIQNRASNEGWRKEQGEIREEVGKATRARIVRAHEEQLEKLIATTETFIATLDGLVAKVSKNPWILMGEKQDAKAADSISKAIETTIRAQRDLYKLPTLDQDMRRKQEAARRREAKARLQLDKAKFEAEQAERAKTSSTASGTLWTVEAPEGMSVDE